MNKKKVKKQISNGQPVTRGIRINTPPIQVEVQSTDESDSLEIIKDMAESIIDKYKNKTDGGHR